MLSVLLFTLASVNLVSPSFSVIFISGWNLFPVASEELPLLLLRLLLLSELLMLLLLSPLLLMLPFMSPMLLLMPLLVLPFLLPAAAAREALTLILPPIT